MAIRREQRGDYYIEASASRLPDKQWQPRLLMTRVAIPPAQWSRFEKRFGTHARS